MLRSSVRSILERLPGLLGPTRRFLTWVFLAALAILAIAALVVIFQTGPGERNLVD